jgi:hypothetical protein
MSGQAAETRRHQEDGERLKATSARHIHSNSRARTQQWKAGACEALKQAQATKNKHRPGSNGNGTVDTVRAIVGADCVFQLGLSNGSDHGACATGGGRHVSQIN